LLRRRRRLRSYFSLGESTEGATMIHKELADRVGVTMMDLECLCKGEATF
jgi:hypothetical protein